MESMTRMPIRDERFELRISAETKRLAAKLADERGLSLSQFTRGLMSEALEQYLQKLEIACE